MVKGTAAWIGFPSIGTVYIWKSNCLCTGFKGLGYRCPGSFMTAEAEQPFIVGTVDGNRANEEYPTEKVAELLGLVKLGGRKRLMRVFHGHNSS